MFCKEVKISANQREKCRAVTKTKTMFKVICWLMITNDVVLVALVIAKKVFGVN